MQFIVGLSGSVSPSFTLVKFRGPAQSGSLAAVSRVRTHTLAIVMASPRGNKANTNDFATESFKLQLQQLIQTPGRSNSWTNPVARGLWPSAEPMRWQRPGPLRARRCSEDRWRAGRSRVDQGAPSPGLWERVRGAATRANAHTFYPRRPAESCADEAKTLVFSGPDL